MKLCNFLILSFFTLNFINIFCSEYNKLNHKLQIDGLATFVEEGFHHGDLPKDGIEQESQWFEPVKLSETYMPKVIELNAKTLKELFGGELGEKLFNQINNSIIFTEDDIQEIKSQGQEKVAKFVVILKNAALFEQWKMEQLEKSGKGNPAELIEIKFKMLFMQTLSKRI